MTSLGKTRKGAAGLERSASGPYLVSHAEPEEYRVRFFWAAGFVLLCLAGLIARLYYIQIVRGQDYAQKSEANFIQLREIPAVRGLVLDRNGEVLADNRPSFDVYLTPAFSPRWKNVLNELDRSLNMTYEELQEARQRIQRAKGLERFRPQLVRDDVDRQELGRILFQREILDGVDIMPKPVRRYRYGSLAAQAFGFLNEISRDELNAAKAQGQDYQQGDFIGRLGLEESWEEYLRGVDGEERLVVDAKGLPVKEEIARELVATAVARSAQAGLRVVTTFDLRLQRAAESILSDVQAGALVALDPNNGEVLALASRPAFDPNKLIGRRTVQTWRELSADPLRPLLDRAVQSTYPPGSVFKAITALAGLNKGVITPKTRVHCPGYLNFGGRKFRCHKEQGHGTVDILDALRVSCDVFFWTVAQRLSMEDLLDAARQLGLGVTTGIDLPGERAGILPDAEYYRKKGWPKITQGLVLNAAIGQGDVTISALQLALAYATIANNGTVYQPRLVSRIEDQAGRIVKEFPTVVKSRAALSALAMEYTRKGLTAVAMQPGGTAYYVRLKVAPRLNMAAKTGTAQVVALGDVRKTKEETVWQLRDHALFVMWAPAENPRLVVAIIHEHGGHGASDAAPYALRLAKTYFDILGLN